MKTKKHLIVLVGAMWVVGCQEGQGLFGTGQPEKLVPEQQLGISDVPVPVRFELEEGESEDKSSGDWRYIHHAYLGKSDTQVLRAFYREHMPLNKWRMVYDEMKQGQFTLRFENDRESCEVTISRIKGNMTTKTKLVIEVSPLTRGKAIEPPIETKRDEGKPKAKAPY